MDGLSPRVRGNPLSPTQQTWCFRSIPACAGEPQYIRGPQSTSTVYPRVCGGTVRNQIAHECVQGLSPRVRGNPRMGDFIPMPVRSIPACAGEPRKLSSSVKPDQVYPRVCGGTMSEGVAVVTYLGLSPRVRGNQALLQFHSLGLRSIPACAGEPTSSGFSMSSNGVYPRVCGGTTYQLRWRVSSIGLSPRVRGNRRAEVIAQAREGSIPACAGEPYRMTTWFASCGVYPRVCGGTAGLTVC